MEEEQNGQSSNNLISAASITQKTYQVPSPLSFSQNHFNEEHQIPENTKTNSIKSLVCLSPFDIGGKDELEKTTKILPKTKLESRKNKQTSDPQKSRSRKSTKSPFSNFHKIPKAFVKSNKHFTVNTQSFLNRQESENIERNKTQKLEFRNPNSRSESIKNLLARKRGSTAQLTIISNCTSPAKLSQVGSLKSNYTFNEQKFSKTGFTHSRNLKSEWKENNFADFIGDKKRLRENSAEKENKGWFLKKAKLKDE